MSFLLKETTGAFDGAQTHDWPMTSLQLDALVHCATPPLCV